MTRGVRTCRQQDDGLSIRSAPRQDDKTSADSHRAQRWRLRLASVFFASVLLADRLWLCAEATRTSSGKPASRDASDQEYRPFPEHPFLFLGNSSRPLRRLEACHPDSVSKSCFAVTDAKAVCSGLSTPEWNLSDLYLPFCDSYSLLDLVNASCGLDMATCTRCVQDYQSRDRRAQERYHEFELLVQKYETDVYSVRTCMDECTVGVVCFDVARCTLFSMC